MSGKAIDYATTPVSFYKFVCNDPEIKSCYVGHTTNFIKRKSQHKRSCINECSKLYRLKVYQIVRENGGWAEWKMIEIDKRLVKDKREAERVETEFMEQLQSDMNCKKAHHGFTTDQEYRKDYKKTHYEEHKDEIILKSRQYKHDHKDEIILKSKEYHQKNRDKILLKHKEKTTCECGCIITKCHMNEHKQSQKHKHLMETKLA